MTFGYNLIPSGLSPLYGDREEKLRRIVHAEMAVLLNCKDIKITDKDILYIAAEDVPSGQVWGGPPCPECCKHVIHAGIRRIITFPMVYAPARWVVPLRQSLELLEEAGVRYEEIPL